MLELMSKKGQSLRELLEPLRQRYFISGEINTKLKSMDAVDLLYGSQTDTRSYATQDEVDPLWESCIWDQGFQGEWPAMHKRPSGRD